ncbi:hypothetical protein [Burkholderia cepacia]|uniref:hypothetical protein n=1 Tax=Burkholderia cepacia TaxID=292 RepID=UPI0007520238|nr:hypothetical protein [Burkholderia cepacia]KVF16967.1 hypothetical protein WJ06_02195 [Burkholderia cepacia]
MPPAGLTGDADADRELVPRYRDLVRHVLNVNEHLSKTAAFGNVNKAFDMLESRADEAAVRAWHLADAYPARFTLPAPQLGTREARIRTAAFERVAAPPAA